VQGINGWVASPEPTAPLSGVVLSLFAVDALSYPEEYSQRASVCDTCNRLTFHGGCRHSCPEHTPRVSGVFRRTTAGAQA
jgi:hypothetical protein